MALTRDLPLFAILRFATAAVIFAGASRADEKPAIPWRPWSDGVFKQAAAEHKLVLLDLEAVWCHWCHVMDALTYSEPRVIELIRRGYIPVRVDQDARPDLANRYEDYGWPATVIFKWDGSELAKRRGYIPPMPMASMLQAFINDPTPGPSVEAEPSLMPAAKGALSDSQVGAMRNRFMDAYDWKRGGWGSGQKFLDWDDLEYCLSAGPAGDTQAEAMARQTLTDGLKLIDPVWGGVDQYSIGGDWEHPHYEKIMPFQAETIRIYATAASLWHEPQWLGPAEKIHGYLKLFLTSPEGAVYTSQNADPPGGEEALQYFALDDAGRRKAGVPRVDRHIYSSDNGLAITGLASLYAASGDALTLADARRAADWVIAHRASPGGGFRHDAQDSAGPYLADTLEMGRAFLALYRVTAERLWLARAEAAADFINARFRAQDGFATAVPTDAALEPEPETDENVTLARFANLLAHYTGKDIYKAMADHAMRYLASPTVVAQQGYAVAGILLASRELATEPTHIAIVGSKEDPAGRALFTAALRDAPPYARLEWYDPKEGPLPNTDVDYPTLASATAFLCNGNACSSPIHTPDALARKLAMPGR
jgi:uncharacterized protein YyaL (SSP411 family)